MSIKSDLYYSEDHQWVKVMEDFLEIGITDFAQSELGDIVFVELPKVGLNFEKNQIFANLESIKVVSDLLMPVGGRTTEVNSDLIDQPNLINEDPYGAGWIIKVDPIDDLELDQLLDLEEYNQLIEA